MDTELNEFTVRPATSPVAVRTVTMATPVANMPMALRNWREPGSDKRGGVGASMGYARRQPSIIATVQCRHGRQGDAAIGARRGPHTGTRPGPAD